MASAQGEGFIRQRFWRTHYPADLAWSWIADCAPFTQNCTSSIVRSGAAP
jgi:hypothetical protein